MPLAPDDPSAELDPAVQLARDALIPYIGERATMLYAYAICAEGGATARADSLRVVLIAAGENPEDPQVTEAERLLIDWGRLMVRDPGGIPAVVQDRVEHAFSESLRELLTRFAGRLIATSAPDGERPHNIGMGGS